MADLELGGNLVLLFFRIPPSNTTPMVPSQSALPRLPLMYLLSSSISDIFPKFFQTRCPEPHSPANRGGPKRAIFTSLFYLCSPQFDPFKGPRHLDIVLQERALSPPPLENPVTPFSSPSGSFLSKPVEFKIFLPPPFRFTSRQTHDT